MRVEPYGVYLRLEPGVTVVNYKTGATHTEPCVELHWKTCGRWQRKTFLGHDGARSMGALLAAFGVWLDSHPNLDAALRELPS